jgi:hypothetical protein
MRRIALPALLALLFGLLPVTASAIDCRSERGSGSWWSWRNVDGKRCWYKGQPGMSKDKLRWATTPQETKRQEAPAKRQEPAAKRQEPVAKRPEPAAKRQEPAAKRPTAQRPSVAPRQDDDERQRLLHSYWPPLPPKESFIERFNAFAPR